MFRNVSDGSVLLGEKSKFIGWEDADNSDPFVTKCGGKPAWFSPGKETSAFHCPKCNDLLVFVTQIYAPIDHPRALYVFGCRWKACTATPLSWRVVRDVQIDAQVEPSQQDQSMKGEESSRGEDRVGWFDDDKMQNTSWGFDVASDEEYGEEGDSNLDTISAMVAKFEQTSIAGTPALPKVTEPHSSSEKQKIAPDVAGSPAGPSDIVAFRPFLLDIYEEQISSIKKEDFAHENSLYQKYLHDEQQQGQDKEQNQTSSEEAHKKKDSADAPESYERTPGPMKRLLEFQTRLGSAPRQCIRYAYGGEPLWPCVPPKLLVPKCKCGKRREFECQLMPAMLNDLQLFEGQATESSGHSESKYLSAASDQKAKAALLANEIEKSMDWSVVTIWSCPNSCTQESEEWIYAHAGLDENPRS